MRDHLPPLGCEPRPHDIGRAHGPSVYRWHRPHRLRFMPRTWMTAPTRGRGCRLVPRQVAPGRAHHCQRELPAPLTRGRRELPPSEQYWSASTSARSVLISTGRATPYLPSCILGSSPQRLYEDQVVTTRVVDVQAHGAVLLDRPERDLVPVLLEPTFHAFNVRHFDVRQNPDAPHLAVQRLAEPLGCVAGIGVQEHHGVAQPHDCHMWRGPRNHLQPEALLVESNGRLEVTHVQQVALEPHDSPFPVVLTT